MGVGTHGYTFDSDNLETPYYKLSVGFSYENDLGGWEIDEEAWVYGLSKLLYKQTRKI